jgi:hypothetical protein
MPRKKWATPDQEEFLLSFLPEFRERAASKQYEDFFSRVWAQWFVRWPERQALFKDKSEEHDLSPDEMKALAEAVTTRKAVRHV